MNLKNMKNFFNDMLNVVYPELCIVCDKEYPLEESCFCFSCTEELPFTGFSETRDNLVEKFFWGRIEIEKGTAIFYFQKAEIIQELIHKFKYRGKTYIGSALGKFYGKELIDVGYLNDVDLIIPIPIHPSKKRSRGYNQSTVFAKEISRVSKIPLIENILLKSTKTKSQTTKSRSDRFELLKQSFKVKNADQIDRKHVLLVDDILTTGATLEVASSLLKKHNVKVSIAVIAVGKY